MEAFSYGHKALWTHRRKVAFLGSLYTVAILTTVALAWGSTLTIPSSGLATGKARAGQAVVGTLLVPTDADIVGSLFPGDPPAAVTMKVQNTGAAPVHVTAVQADPAETTKVTVRNADGTCNLGADTGTGGSINTSVIDFAAVSGLTAPSIPAGTTQVITIPGRVTMDASAPTGCSNAIFDFKLQLTLAAGV